MANTFNQLSYANTFGDWVIISNYHSTELNAIGKGNYVKDTGLLTLASPGIALQVANNSLFQGNVVITGAGSALQVSNDVLVSGNLIVKGNTTISINEIDYGTIISNNFTANTATIINLSTTNSTSNLVKLHNKMAAEDIDYVVYKSGRKVGATQVNSLYTGGQFNNSPFEGIINVPFGIICLPILSVIAEKGV